MKPPARAAAAALAAAALAAGCGSEELPAIHLDAAQRGAPAREPGLTVLRFVQAARRGDAPAMWTLLSRPTRDSIGPSLDAFTHGAAQDLTDDLEGFRDAEVIVSRRLTAAWAVAAVRGRDDDDGDLEPAAYAAALRREDGAWKLELEGLVIARLRPPPDEETGDRPELRAEAQAGGAIDRIALWLDGRDATAGRVVRSPFSAELRGRPATPLAAGEHVAVVFASTRETAAALAWTFAVE